MGHHTERSGVNQIEVDNSRTALDLLNTQPHFYLLELSKKQHASMLPHLVDVDKVVLVSGNFENDIEAISKLQNTIKLFTGKKTEQEFNSKFYPVKQSHDEFDHLGEFVVYREIASDKEIVGKVAMDVDSYFYLKENTDVSFRTENRQ